MATVTYSAKSGGVVNSVTGSFTSDGSAQTLTFGFKPNWVKVWNETDVILWEAISVTTATKAWKVVTGGTTTLDTGSAIVINSDGTVTLSATAVGTSKLITFYATV
jgi:hypothetical protein